MKEYKDKNWLYINYVEKGLSSYALAELQNCTPTTIRSWLKRYSIPTRTAGDYSRLNISKIVLTTLYVDQHKTISEVANILSVTSNTVIAYLRKHDIESRRVSDYPSFLKGHQSSRKKITGRPCSLETRLKISKTKTHGEWKGFANQNSIFRQYCNTPQYKEWRQSIFIRDGFICQQCLELGGYMEVHHIIPLRDYAEGIMEDNNAITLCRKCHGRTKNREYDFNIKFSSIVGVD